MKSYNMQALRGHDYDDHTFQQDMRESGIHIPDNLLYTPKLVPYVVDEMHKQNIQGLPQVDNPITGKLYTPEEARAEADELRKTAMNNYDRLLSS